MLDTKIQQATAKSIVKCFFGKFAENLDSRVDNINFGFTDASSNFDFAKQTIFINRNYAQDVNLYVHELLHALSTRTYDNKLCIGFNKKEFSLLLNDKILETSVGYAINEGATHSLTRDATAGRFGEVIGTTHYNFCANIYKNIESIVGQEMMHFCYLQGGVNGFINLVSTACHTAPSNVINLILNMDAYFDTQRVYSVFLLQENSQDALSLLSNCYSYLAKIMGDYYKFQGKNFDAFVDIKDYNLSDKEKPNFYKSLKSIEDIDRQQNFALKDYEKMAQYIFENIDNTDFSLNILPKHLKNANFLNYLLINNFYVDDLKIRESLKTHFAKSKLTEMLFLPQTNALSIDSNLPYDIRTLLSTRFVVRADTTICDEYMKLCLNDKNFCDYLKKTDWDYYCQISKDDSKEEQK